MMNAQTVDGRGTLMLSRLDRGLLATLRIGLALLWFQAASWKTPPGEQAALHALLDELHIPPEDRVIRPVALRGAAADGVTVTVETLLLEVTVTADGVYWHPVGAEHLDQLVTRDLFPLGAAIEEIQRRFADYHRQTLAAIQRFPCA